MESAVSEYAKEKTADLGQLKVRWASACSEFEAARNSDSLNESPRDAGEACEALANILTVKSDIDRFIAGPGHADGPFVVGIINLAGRDSYN